MNDQLMMTNCAAASDPQQGEKVVPAYRHENQEILTISTIWNDKCIQIDLIPHLLLNFIAWKEYNKREMCQWVQSTYKYISGNVVYVQIIVLCLPLVNRSSDQCKMVDVAYATFIALSL